MLYFRKLLLNLEFEVEMYLEFKNKKNQFTIIPTGNKN